MPVSNIKRKLIAKHGIKADTIKDLMLYLFKNFPEKQAKKMANSFIGDRKYNRTDYGFTCQDLQTCQDVWTQGTLDGKNVTIDKFEDMYLIREQKVERILSDHTSINRFVISGSILQCLSLLKRNWTKNSELYSINTDGFYMTNPKYEYENKADVKFDVKSIGKPLVTDSVPNYFDKKCRENMDVNDYKDIVSESGKIIYGQAGCGKTYKLCDMIYEHKGNCLVFSHTNKAVVNIKNRLIEMKVDNVNKICHTFRSFFYDDSRGVDDLKDKIVFVDEYTMTPNRYITLLFLKLINNSLRKYKGN